MKLSLRNIRPARTATVAIASVAAGMALTVPGLALASHVGQAVPAPPANPTSADQIQNIDQVRTAIKGYYGAIQSGTNPIDGTTLTQYDPNGSYAHEVKGIAAGASKYLAHHHKRTAGKAVLFDVDDTTLNTYSSEIYSNFVYNPTSQYKSLTRQYIESLGYDIVATFGDQFSDLKGGFADTTYKIPNPMYFLP